MQQTLLGILAMAVAVTFAFTNQQRYVMTAHDLLIGELEEMAGAVTVEGLEVVRARVFDEALLVAEGQVGPSDFAESPFEGGRECRPFHEDGEDCEAIEHFHEMETGVVEFVISQDTFHFSVDMEVEYVDEDHNPSSVPTTRKRVTVKVQDAWPGSSRAPFIRRPIALSRVFTYTGG